MHEVVIRFLEDGPMIKLHLEQLYSGEKNALISLIDTLNQIRGRKLLDPMPPRYFAARC